jgi:tRNA (guanine37-N1)-methyltransferase
VAKWRRRAALLKTLKTRPDLIEKAALTDDERRWLDDVMRIENIQS